MNQQTPFRKWLAQARIPDTPTGDLIADFRRAESQLPADFCDAEAMRAFLRTKGAPVRRPSPRCPQYGGAIGSGCAVTRRSPPFTPDSSDSRSLR
jgi:hypothetical protein